MCSKVAKHPGLWDHKIPHGPLSEAGFAVRKDFPFLDCGSCRDPGSWQSEGTGSFPATPGGSRGWGAPGAAASPSRCHTGSPFARPCPGPRRHRRPGSRTGEPGHAPGGDGHRHRQSPEPGARARRIPPGSVRGPGRTRPRSAARPVPPAPRRRCNPRRARPVPPHLPVAARQLKR